MKEDTKKKIKKIAKVSGFIITFGFAVFGVLCAAVLMANASGAKDNIKTLDNSLVQNEVRSKRIEQPRKADEEEGVYLLGDVGLGGYHINIGETYFEGGEPMNATTYGLNPSSSYTIPYGYYRITSLDGNGFYIFATSSSSGAWEAFVDSYNDRNEPTLSRHSFLESSIVQIAGSNVKHYLSYDGSQQIYFHGAYVSQLRLELVNTLEVAPSDVISLPAKWSPLGMFGGSISEDGNILTNTEWVTGYEEKITLKGFLFRNQGIVYNRMRIILYWLGGTGAGNTEIGYVDAKGDFHVGLSSQWCIRSIEYAFNTTDDVNNNVDDLYRFTAGQTRIDFTNTKVSVYPGIVWQNEGANVLEIIDKEYSSNGKRYTYGGLSIGANLTDYEFLVKYNSVVALEVMGDTSLVFALMSSAFGSVTPLLSIAILPNITLGMLLFFPLVGAIIVIIIKVIKK